MPDPGRAQHVSKLVRLHRKITHEVDLLDLHRIFRFHGEPKVYAVPSTRHQCGIDLGIEIALRDELSPGLFDDPMYEDPVHQCAFRQREAQHIGRRLDAYLTQSQIGRRNYLKHHRASVRITLHADVFKAAGAPQLTDVLVDQIRVEFPAHLCLQIHGQVRSTDRH